MKKVKLHFSAIGADPGEDNWESAKGDYEKLPNWDFLTNPIYTGYLIYIKEAVKTKWEPKTILKVYNATTKQSFTIWCNGVLAKDMMNVPPLSKIKITYKGKSKGKTYSYHNYEVMFNAKEPLVLADHPDIGQTEATNYSSSSRQTASVKQPESDKPAQATNNTASSVIDDDLPF